MTKYKHKQPKPKSGPGRHETTDWTYYLSRDSLDGALSAKCSVWNQKPLRTRVGGRVVWSHDTGHLGEFRPDEILAWLAFKTYPETDRELLVVETRPSAEELAEAEKQVSFK